MHSAYTPTEKPLLSEFFKLYDELDCHMRGESVIIDGHALSIASLTAVARYKSRAVLSESMQIRSDVLESRKTLLSKLQAGNSIYGVSTGFGGSADTRTGNHLALGNALFQMQHCGILPSADKSRDILPLSDAMHSLSMPESWVRAAIVIRMNSLIRGHSGVRWEVLESMEGILRQDIIPVVPLRGSISASGDLSPLSYVAGTLMGNPRIKVYTGAAERRLIVTADAALLENGLNPIEFQSKEHLGLLNGTAFSAAVAGLALFEAIQLALLTQVCTAMSTEALMGSTGSFSSFIHEVARPHPGQIESAATIKGLLRFSKLANDPKIIGEKRCQDDKGLLKQDRYALRTAPQFIGPQLEDIHASLLSVHQELNSTTDNPLVDSKTQTIHDTGNFQAMAVTNAMEKTRLSLHHLGKILFAQGTELINPDMNKGLAPSLAGGDPSLDYHCKGLDISLAAYVSELGYLANPVSTHVQSAEMHNQAINSLALISARSTMSSLEVLTMIVSTCIYITCQAFDLRAMDQALFKGFREILSTSFEKYLRPSQPSLETRLPDMISTFNAAFAKASKLDASDRIHSATKAVSILMMEHAFGSNPDQVSNMVKSLPKFQAQIESHSLDLLQTIRKDFLATAHLVLPAAPLLGASRAMYIYVRKTLGIKMHGGENITGFENGLNSLEPTIGERVSLIYDAIREGNMAPVLMQMLR